MNASIITGTKLTKRKMTKNNKKANPRAEHRSFRRFIYRGLQTSSIN